MPNPATALDVLTNIGEQRLVTDGYISGAVHEGTKVAAPSSFADELYVIVPEHSNEVPLGPCDWGAIHGGTLPAQNARCVVVFDEREVPVIVWWEGAYTKP